MFETLQTHITECKKQILLKNDTNVFVCFVQFTLALFPIREKLGLNDLDDKKQKQDTILGALKFFYEAIKHTDDFDEIAKVNIFYCESIYPMTYPYFYGQSTVCFGDIDKLAEFRKAPKQKGNMIELHNRHLKGKSVTTIMDWVVKETIRIYNEKQ